MLIEIIATTLQEAIDIEKSGANRIELVSGILEGGLTPSLGLVEEVCKSVTIPVNVMVRPHSKSFVYDKNDMKVILQDIENIKGTKANGIVFGSLTKEQKVDFNQLNEVIKHKGNLMLTFHRAIDNSVNYLEDFKTLLGYDIDVILTSAGESKVTENIKLVNHLVDLSKNTGTTVLAGSGLSSTNVLEFIQQTRVSQIHMGSGVKFEQNNLNDIDIKLLRNLVNSIQK